jgi:hypothetical protein
MISATTTRELSTGLDEPAGKTHIAWTSDCNRRCRRLRPVDARHKHTTSRAPSEMVAWWTPGRRLLGRPPSGLSCGWKGTRTRRSRVVWEELDRAALDAPVNGPPDTGDRSAFPEQPRPRRTKRGPAAGNARCAAQDRGSSPLAPPLSGRERGGRDRKSTESGDSRRDDGQTTRARRPTGRGLKKSPQGPSRCEQVRALPPSRWL